MRTETKEYKVLTADEGYFLSNSDGSVYGIQIVLGEYDSAENYREVPLSEYPVIMNGNNVLNESEVTPLAIAKQRKLNEITAYDLSENVNRFYYDERPMWLDKATRVGLVNSLNSAEVTGEENMTIWYNGSSFTLTIESAKAMLAALEMYAVSCYNVTEMHKRNVRELETISDVLAYDITQDYPQKLFF